MGQQPANAVIRISMQRFMLDRFPKWKQRNDIITMAVKCTALFKQVADILLTWRGVCVSNRSTTFVSSRVCVSTVQHHLYFQQSLCFQQIHPQGIFKLVKLCSVAVFYKWASSLFLLLLSFFSLFSSSNFIDPYYSFVNFWLDVWLWPVWLSWVEIGSW
jgi:hypothetical protein